MRIKSTGLYNFSMPHHQIKALILPILLLILIAGCSSKQPSVKTSETQAVNDIEKVEADSLTANDHILHAQTLTGTAAIEELILASKLFFQQEDYVQALWLADKAMPLVDNDIPNHIEEKIQLALIKVTSLQQLSYFTESQNQLKELALFYNNNNIALPASYYHLLSKAHQANNRPIAALSAQLFAFSLTEPHLQTTEQVEAIWLKLQNLAQWQLDLLALEELPDSEAWLELTTIANKFAANNQHLNYQLSVWQRKFKLHPANVIAKQLSEQSINRQTIKNIAVILPLTGKQRLAGLAIQQGILASFDNDKTKALHFIDSNTLNWYGLTNELSILNIDYVIGPLLKSNVDKYISYTSGKIESQNDYILNEAPDLFDKNNTDITTNSLPKDKQPDYLSTLDSDNAMHSYLQPTTSNQSIPTLLLNLPADAPLTEHHTVLSMRPEDEAYQAAVTLYQQEYKKPIVLSQNTVVSKRIAQAFAKQWQMLTGNRIEVVDYNNGAQMQQKIKASLAVDTSKARINKLKSLLTQTIKSQTRNRRDIDMIYLVGTPAQTRLVKPYIEVNISPFSKKIPVFASSRSHSGLIDNSSNSDLKGLTFTEIPWLLPEEQKSQLAALNHELWPKRSDGQSRLFAMGYDSYQLVNKIPLMQQAPYIQHWGKTGVLKLNPDNVLTRSLLWGTYKNNKVVSIAME